MDTKKCLECGKDFYGRADKKFCSDSCRNAYHNRSNSNDEVIIKRVNRILRKNRLILSQLNPDEKTKVPLKKLTKLGFDFDYITSIHVTKEAKQYRFCYDQGYLQINDTYILLVKKKSND